jgi:hypothetical protein
MEAVLSRFAYTPHGTFGRLYVNGFECYTVERPWLNNRRNMSCIPTGRYILERTMFYRGTPDEGDDYEVYEVIGVAGRDHIKLHVANTMDDVKGCIGPGLELGWVKNRWGVVNSQLAFAEFMLAMGDVQHAHVFIRNQFPYRWE